MSDIIERGDVMQQVAVSRHSGAGTLIFSNISEDDPRIIKGSAPVFITAIIDGFHIEYPMSSEESGPERRPCVLVDAQIESIRGGIGGLERTLVFADYDAQKFSFYYPISDEELMNMISDGLFRYKTFADTLAAQMKDEYREVSFSCDLDYTLFLKTPGDFGSKQILICDPVSIFHDRSFLEPSLDFIPPGIQENENIYGLSFRLDEASESVGKICAETDQEEAAVRSVNDVKIRDLNEDLLSSILSSEQIEALLNEAEEDLKDDYVPDAALWEDEEEEKVELRADDPLFSFDPMAEGPEEFAPNLLEEDEPEENVPHVPGLDDARTSEKTDTVVVTKGDELAESVRMTEERKLQEERERELAAKEEAERIRAEELAKEKANEEIDELFADIDDEPAASVEPEVEVAEPEETPAFSVETDGEEIVTSKAAEEEKLETEMLDVDDLFEDVEALINEPIAEPTVAVPVKDIAAEEEKLQQKAEDAGLYEDNEDEDDLFIEN